PTAGRDFRPAPKTFPWWGWPPRGRPGAMLAQWPAGPRRHAGRTVAESGQDRVDHRRGARSRLAGGRAIAAALQRGDHGLDQRLLDVRRVGDAPALPAAASLEHHRRLVEGGEGQPALAALDLHHVAAGIAAEAPVAAALDAAGKHEA